MSFRFDPEKHEYWLDDRRMESVTEILGDAGLTDYRFSHEWYMTRGKYIHTASEMIDRNTLDWTTLDPVLVPYCEAYRSFVEDCRPVVAVSEKPLYHATHLFAGTPDRVVKMNGRMVIMDIKTGLPVAANWLQVAAYRELIQANENIHATQGAVLCLQDDGKYRLKTCNLKDMKRDYQIFLAALTVVRWKKEAA
jgi:hypothetical protein